MARSEENTIISPDAEADGNENLPMKVYKPSTWTSQPGARLTKYGQRGQPAAAPLRKQRSDTERSPAAPYVDRLRGSGSYDVDDRFTEYEEGLHKATAVRRKESNAELNSEAQNAYGPSNSGSYDMDAGPTAYGLGGQPATTGPEVRLRNTKRSSPAQLSDRPHSSGTYDVVDDETRKVQDNEVFSDVSSKGFTSNYITAPTSLDSPKKKAYFDIPETEQRGERGDQALWRKLLDATSIRATLPDAPKERRSMPAQGSQGLASIPRSQHMGSSDVTPGPNPEAFSRKVAPAGEQGDESPPHRIPSLRSPVIESVGEHEDDERVEQSSHIGKHGLLYYVWVLSTSLFMLLVVPAAILILSHRRSDFVAALLKINVTAPMACVEDVNDTVMCNEYPKTVLSIEDEAWQPSNDSAPLPPRDPIATHRKPATLVRPVICVLNLGTQELWERYVMTNITVTYCTVVLWESLSLGTPKDHKLGRRGTLAVDKEKFDLMVDHTKQFRTARNGSLLIYVTLGGQRSDSPAYVSMLHSEGWQVSVVVSLRRFNGILHGVNVYWNYPRDSCDTNNVTSIKVLHLFLRRLKSRNMGVMLTVPPVRDLVRQYGLTDSLLDNLSYVLVTTHKLQPCDGRVSCSGLRQFAASAFLRVRTDYDIRHRQKFAYSISARVDTFMAKAALGSTNYATPLEFGAMLWNKSPEYLGHTEVCRAKKVQKSKDDECTLAVLDDVKDSDGVTWHRLATYTSPHQMQLRMQRAFCDAMGDSAVALFDSQLDDISGECEAEEGLHSTSSLVVAMATTGPRA